jgi:hypothetical protein
MEDRKMKKVATICSVVMFILALGVIAHAQTNVAGTWTMTNQGRNGTVMTTMTLTQDGGTLKGSLKGANGMEVPLDSGSIDGNNITFTVTRNGRNGQVMVTYKGTVDGNMMKGTFSAGQNDVEWTATKGE